ncbi:MAG: GLPGLI family protein, partial [Bacteroidota bacterium]
MRLSAALFMLALMTGTDLQAQSVQVIYAETRDLTKQVQGVSDPAVLAVLGSLSKEETLYILDFSTGKSTYQKKKTMNAAGGTNVTVIDISGEGYRFYKDQKTKKTIEQNSVLNKKFLIEEDLLVLDWKVEGEATEEIAGYKVNKAIATTEHGKEITAWFTADLPVNDGPRHYWGLPGLILKVMAGDKTIQARNLTLN